MNDSLLEFPCDYPLKIMGRAGRTFEEAVIAILRRHVPDLDENAISKRASREGTYCAISVTLRATSRAQLDALYHELVACDQVAMAL